MKPLPGSTCPECDHFWSQHDLYGCQLYQCTCLRIDRNERFDKANKRAVLDPVPTDGAPT